MRAGPGFRVELQRAGAEPREVETLHRAVVERDVRHLLRRRGLDREAVVLARHQDAIRALVEHGMVVAAVVEGQLVSLVAGSQGKELMPKADAEERHAAEE